MRCIVTGGAGFIGSHLTDRLLLDGHKVTVIDDFSTGREENLLEGVYNKNLVDIKNLNITDWKIRELFENTDWVFHLAGKADIVPSIEKPADYYNTNVTGTLNILEACRTYGVKKLVYASSSSIYGDKAKVPTKETYKPNPKYPYALTKYLGEQLVMHYGQVYKLPVVSLRLFNVYGPRSRTSGAYGAVMGVFLAQKANGIPFTRVGDGEQERDFTYVSDVVDAFILGARSSITREVINIGYGLPYSINSLIVALSGPEAQITQLPKRPGEPISTWADISKARELLAWSPLIPFILGIKYMLGHLEDWENAPVWTAEKVKEATKPWFDYLGKK